MQTKGIMPRRKQRPRKVMTRVTHLMPDAPGRTNVTCFGKVNAPLEQVEEAARMGLNVKAGTQKSAKNSSSLASKKEAARTKSA